MDHEREDERLHDLTERIRALKRSKRVKNPRREKPRNQILQQRDNFFN